MASPLTVPVTMAGNEDMMPGEWAAYIKTLPWKIARVGDLPKTTAMKALMESAAVREPVPRATTWETSSKMVEKISSRAVNVESALIQITGDVSQPGCKRCMRGSGPWAQCVRFDDDELTVTACGNCHWGGHKTWCEFYQPPVSEEAPQAHRRGRSSALLRESQSNTASESTACVTARLRELEELERVLWLIQARSTVDGIQNAAIHRIIQADPNRDIMTERALTLIPTTTLEEQQSEFDQAFRLLNQIKLAGAEGRGV